MSKLEKLRPSAGGKKPSQKVKPGVESPAMPYERSGDGVERKGALVDAATRVPFPHVPDYSIQSRRVPSDENAPIMKSTMDKDGHIKFRLSPQIYDAVNIRYVALLGQQIRLKVWTPEGVDRLVDAIDTLIEAGEKVDLADLTAHIREYANL